ncbi:tRNA-dihydrouridine synthase B [Lineolata rhizophorae]|uniref:tRNA-dihydrouridine(47) synthase [NAD(P)(+)] n=1 Tax=Lineolata rhizophorae TaxID=578093 RepID=A0A6A6P2D9_9PEZI|nr:tRNA-dihydrouridine synthase B [Lineolata rhizophorae]
MDDKPTEPPVSTDDAVEAAGYDEKPGTAGGRSGGRNTKPNKKKERGQNTNRTFGSSRDVLQLCSTRTFAPESAPEECKFGSKCKFEHDLRRYLREGKRADLDTLGGTCPVWAVRGACNAGWKCRFVGSHSREMDEGGLVLVEDEERKKRFVEEGDGKVGDMGVLNVVSLEDKMRLSRKKFKAEKSDKYLEYLAEMYQLERDAKADEGDEDGEEDEDDKKKDNTKTKDADGQDQAKHDNRAQYVEPPFLPSEKRRLYYGPDMPILAPLTTQGNLPFRRLCVSLGAQATWSEMAMGLPLLQGEKSEWALMKAHASEAVPPTLSPSLLSTESASTSASNGSMKNGTILRFPTGYDNAKDTKFGAQIAANKPWIALKTTEVLTTLCPSLRAVDLNVGCPLDAVTRLGAGAALLDTRGKLEKMLRGMSAVSGEVPVTVKIRMGPREAAPVAHRLVTRFALGGPEARARGEAGAGVAAITLHGRSKMQRYTRTADWGYIADCAALIRRIHVERAATADTAREPDERDLPNGGRVFFVGNGDVFSHADYGEHLRESGVDAVMVARGALIKPWVFEEIATGQYLDKSASERLGYVEQFAKWGLEHWGADEMGVGQTRRFLLEWLNFHHRYVPVGLLERLPPRINERPPLYRGRNEMETLLASDNYKDWIKISEMFLGPAHPNFRFEPKHKSNSYDTLEAEG